MLKDKKIYIFSLTKTGKKRKRLHIEPIEAITIIGQRSFEIHNQINPIQITIDDNRIVNILKKHAKVYYKFMLTGILFPASVKNNTEQI